MTVALIRGNALALPLADGTVDLCCTSPPYFALRSYTDAGEHYSGQIGSEPTPAEFLDALLAATAEMIRVLKPSGSIFVNLGDKYNSAASGQQNGNGHKSGLGGGRHDRMQGRGKTTGAVPTKSLMGLPWRYAIRCMDELGLILRAEIIWSKPNGLPESVTDRVRRSHEQWFHFTKQPRYFAAVDPIREPQNDDRHTRTRHTRTDKRADHEHRYLGTRESPPQPGTAGAFHPAGKLPSSVWSIPTQPLSVPPELGVDHFAAFPMEWPRRIIQGWSPAAGVVLDPFGGTSTTAMVASALGRHGISLDMSADYLRLARWRSTDPRERAKAAGVEAPPPVPEGMDSLW